MGDAKVEIAMVQDLVSVRDGGKVNNMNKNRVINERDCASSTTKHSNEQHILN